MPHTPRPWYRRQTGWWMVQINRRKIKLTKGPKDRATRKRAKERLKELLTQRSANPAAGSLQTVASVIEKFLKFAEGHYAPRAFYERRLLLQDFAERHGFRKVIKKDSIPYHVTEWLQAHPEWKSDWTKSHAVAVLQCCFNWARREGLVRRNPYRSHKQPQGEPRRPLTEEEFRTLLRVANGKRHTIGVRFRQVATFLRFTGARIGEARSLRWEHIDLEAGVIRIQRHKTRRTQQAKKPRVIPLHPVVVKLLVFLRRQHEHPEYVFVTHRKKPWSRNGLPQRVRRARMLAKIPKDAKLGGLRHAFGIRAICNGVDLKTLSELMGHTTTRMTEHYLASLGHQAEHLAAAMMRANGPRQAS